MRLTCLILTLASTALLLGCSNSRDGGASLDDGVAYAATVHRTEGGFPHIVAQDFGSLGFGTGYAAAQDNVCIMAKNILRLRGQLSQYLGPNDGNLNSDLFRAYMVQTGMYTAQVSPEMEFLYAGFAAGYNHYLRQTTVSKLPDPACRGAKWIMPMRAEDVRRAELTPVFLPHLANLFLAATPPMSPTGNSSTANKVLSDSEKAGLAVAIETMATAHDKGSNGVAIGSEHTAHSGGLLYTNPHLDWDVSFQFFPRHQIIPGVTNLLGANTYERPLVGFGTNGDVAWTNTVTASRTQALYQLELTPGNPMSYQYDGREEAIKAIPLSVAVLQADGSVKQQSHTLYESRHGLLLGMLFPWDAEKAFALRVADEGNRGQNGQFKGLARATNVREIRTVLGRYQATANTNTIAADSNGEAFYGDLGPVANLTDAQLRDCALPTPVPVPRFAPAFRGNTSDCAWQTDPDSAAPGLLGTSKQAALIRRDYVTNSNDSYWLANPQAPIEGIPQVQGSRASERTLRTRSGLATIEQRIAGTDGLPGNTFDVESIVDRMLSNENLAGRLLRDDLVVLCRDNPNVEVDGTRVDLAEACAALAGWDLHSNLDSRGAHLFREFIRAASGGTFSRRLPAGLNYSVPFDIEDPVNTPRGLDTDDNPAALEALARAVVLLEEAGIALDARLGDLQTVRKNDRLIPLHGGEEGEGVFNKMAFNFAGSEGYPAVTGSSASWIMAVELTGNEVKARGVLAYSLSTNTESPHYADMTEMFSRKELLDLPYRLRDVENAALSTLELRAGVDDCGAQGWREFAEPAFASETDCRSAFRAIADSQLRDWVDE
ncbi:penicillin acylase family protein [Pseudohalioglobus lutimaris]|uniref:Acylase n=1 Tax=Pseudohalioglobus lutimaris TaxID=1737061 RepID=A0A2N5X6K6_9GAMM|nr:penicillin acylase family protein [Pseudohalioglobus lutimaris]PLW70117.1 acylase [Pseudohalioglobus lutimaris]